MDLLIFTKYLIRLNSSLGRIGSSSTLNLRKPVSRGSYRTSSSLSYIPRQCETPILKNGSVRLRQRGKIIRYFCYDSFTLIGDQYSSCLKGQWENPVPMCISMNSMKHLAVLNVNFILNFQHRTRLFNCCTTRKWVHCRRQRRCTDYAIL